MLLATPPESVLVRTTRGEDGASRAPGAVPAHKESHFHDSALRLNKNFLWKFTSVFANNNSNSYHKTAATAPLLRVRLRAGQRAPGTSPTQRPQHADIRGLHQLHPHLVPRLLLSRAPAIVSSIVHPTLHCMGHNTGGRATYPQEEDP